MKHLLPILLLLLLLLTACAKPEPDIPPERMTSSGVVVLAGENQIVLSQGDEMLEIMVDDDTVYLDRGGQPVEDNFLEIGAEVTVTYECLETEAVGVIVVIESVISTQVGEGIGSLGDCIEPPGCMLESTYGEKLSLRSDTYAWQFPTGEGEMTDISAVGAHPMEIAAQLPCIYSADTLYLHFDYAPLKITAHCWQADDFGNVDAAAMETACTATSLSLQPGLNCYELQVVWEADNGTGGTACYVFTANTLPNRIT